MTFEDSRKAEMQFINNHDELKKLQKNMKGTGALIEILTKL